MTTKRTGYPVIDQLLETIAPPLSSAEPDETYQCDACDRVITEDERRGGIRGGGEGTFCSECCGEAVTTVTTTDNDRCAYYHNSVQMACGGQRRFHDNRYKDHDFVEPRREIAKHPFEPMPNDSVSCRVCDQVPSHEAHANVPVPAPEPAGEWSYKVVTGRYKIYDEHGEQVATADSEQVAVAIVADHHAAQVQVGLVEALCQCQTFLEHHTHEQRGVYKSLLDTVDAALQAA